MRLSEKTVQQVRQYQDILTVISEYVQLKRRGRNYIGLCPFHGEKSPSFTVSPDKRIFHCFGCHESGDLISFIQKIDNVSFVEAVVLIAKKAGIDVIEDNNTHYKDPNSELRKQLSDIVYDFVILCESHLKSTPPALDYLSSRGLTEEAINEFRLGVCPGSLDVESFFKKKGVNEDILMKSGLFFKTDTGVLHSRFKNRITFPVSDYQGRFIGVAGRIYLPNQQGAKYVNSEETMVYNKRHLLYGLNKAKKGIKDKGGVLLVEGYMDVIMCHQSGFMHAVAAMGTAITQYQAQKLRRFTDTVYLSMDGDEAGQNSIEKSYDVFQSLGFSIYVVNLPSKDPFDVITELGASEFECLLNQAIPFIQFQFNRLISSYDITKIEHVVKVIDAIVPFLKREKEPVIQRHYVQEFSKGLNIEDDLLVAKLSNMSYTKSRKKFQLEKEKKSKFYIAEKYLVGMAALRADHRQYIAQSVNSSDFSDSMFKKIFSILINSPLEGSPLYDSFNDYEMKTTLFRILLECSEEFSNQKEEFIDDCIQVICERKKSDRKIEIKSEIKRFEKEGNSDEISRLLLELQELNEKGV